MIDEVGVRMQTGDAACRTFTNYDVDPSPAAHDNRMKNVFANTEAIRHRGSVISFGMVVDTQDNTGYEFCQVELAAADGDRVLLVAIKIPDENEKKVSSLYFKKQPQNEDMHELVIQRFIGVDRGFFTVKEYGKLEDEPSAPLGAKSHQFYKLKLGEERDKEMFQSYSRQVGRAFLESHQFNAGVFEEWRQMIPSQTIDKHLQDIHEMYTQEILRVAGQLNTPRMEPRGMGIGGNRYPNLGAISERNEGLRRKLHILRYGQMYVASRRRDLEYERVQEYNFGKKIGPDVKPASGTTAANDTTSRPSTPNLSRSGSTTPTNSPVRRAEMARLATENDELAAANDELRKALETIMSHPRVAILKASFKAPKAALDEERRLRPDEEEGPQVIIHTALKTNGVSDADADAETYAEVDVAGNTGPDAPPFALLRARAKARANARAKARAKADASTATIAGAATIADAATDGDVATNVIAPASAGAAMDAGASDNAGGSADANASADASVDASVAAFVDASVAASVDASVGVNTNVAANVAANAVADSDSDSSDDDEEGGVRLVPEPVNTEKKSSPPATPSKPTTLDSQCDPDSTLPSEESSPKKRSKSDASQVSTRSISPEDNSSTNGDYKIESGGGTPDTIPSPKKRKLSHGDEPA